MRRRLGAIGKSPPPFLLFSSPAVGSPRMAESVRRGVQPDLDWPINALDRCSRFRAGSLAACSAVSVFSLS